MKIAITFGVAAVRVYQYETVRCDSVADGIDVKSEGSLAKRWKANTPALVLSFCNGGHELAKSFSCAVPDFVLKIVAFAF